jgi:hypothetical protein
MLLMTSLSTGLFSAMLRSTISVIMVAFLIVVAYAAAAVLYGASLIGLLLAVAGFNGGLILYLVGNLVRSGTRAET